MSDNTSLCTVLYCNRSSPIIRELGRTNTEYNDNEPSYGLNVNDYLCTKKVLMLLVLYRCLACGCVCGVPVASFFDTFIFIIVCVRAWHFSYCRMEKSLCRLTRVYVWSSSPT
jgi:hypothetical protein